jgi:hypothetical protein
METTGSLLCSQETTIKYIPNNYNSKTSNFPDNKLYWGSAQCGPVLCRTLCSVWILLGSWNMAIGLALLNGLVMLTIIVSLFTIQIPLGRERSLFCAGKHQMDSWLSFKFNTVNQLIMQYQGTRPIFSFKHIYVKYKHLQINKHIK